MGNYQAILSLIEELEVRCWTTQVYIKVTGSLDLGVFLERIVWWSDKTSRTDGFFWKKAEEWRDELGISYAQLKRMEKDLRDMGFIETTLKRANSAPTTHYKPVMPVILNSINTIFRKPEIQESRKSEKPNLDFQETSNSDFQETSKTLTGKTHEEQHEESRTHERDYANDLLRLQGQPPSGITGDNPDDQWLIYRQEFLNIHTEMIGKRPDVAEREAISELSSRPDADPVKWRLSYKEARLNWTGRGPNPSLARVIEYYNCGGAHEAWQRWKYPESPTANGPPKNGQHGRVESKVTGSFEEGFNL